MGGSCSGVCLVDNTDGLVKRKRTFAAATALVQQKNKNIPIDYKGMKEKMQVKNLKTKEKIGIVLKRAGRIQTGSYINKDGQKVYTTDVVVEEHEFCESKASAHEATRYVLGDPSPIIRCCKGKKKTYKGYELGYC